MAEMQHSVDYVEVKADDILADRQNGWAAFTRAAMWGVVSTAVLLIALKVLFG